MRRFAWTLAATVLTLNLATGQGPDAPKPGPEHEMLKKREGKWAVVMKADGNEFKGTAVYKMELDGLWLSNSTEVDMGGSKFAGRGMDSYDAKTRAFCGVWVDNMITKPMVFTGTYDAKTKTITSVADGVGPDGKPAKWKSLDVHIDDDTFDFKMYINDGKEPAFVITHKRVK